MNSFACPLPHSEAWIDGQFMRKSDLFVVNDLNPLNPDSLK